MFVLGLMGSPRRQGNTELLLDAFLEGAYTKEAEVLKLDVPSMNIAPCRGCRYCEREGYCIQKDGMEEVFYLLRRADIVVVATPIYFYGPSAQMKALIDRSQTLWARRYVMKLVDPKTAFRKGFLLAVGATKGEGLFKGTTLTAKYFFDAIGARYEGFLGFRGVDLPGAIAEHPTALNKETKKGEEIVGGLSQRRRVLILCRHNAARSQITEAFLHYYAGEKIEAVSAGDEPAAEVDPLAVKVMAERGIDIAYQRPQGLEALGGRRPYDLAVHMGCMDSCPVVPAAEIVQWELEDPQGRSREFFRSLRDDIELRVKGLAMSLR